MPAPRTSHKRPRRSQQCRVRRWLWAATVAKTAMGKRKPWGDKPVWIAEDDPLAWWVLTELIAKGGPDQ